MVNSTNNFEELLKNESLTREQKAQVINDYYDNYRKSIDKDLNNYLMKQYIGAGLQIGSAAIPMGGAANIGSKIGIDLLSKTVGKKIASEAGAGAVSGLASGAVFGLGRGLSEGENPLKTAYEDSRNGMNFGLLGGAAGAYAKRFIDGKLLKNYGDIDILPTKQRQQYNTDAREYYKNYNQGIELEDINFSNKGIQETLRWNPKQAQNFPSLLNDIKNSKRLLDSPNLKKEQKPNVSHYELYQGQHGFHHVEVAKGGDKRFYITKDNIDNGYSDTSLSSKHGIVFKDLPNQINTPERAAQTTSLGPNRSITTQKSDNIIINDVGKNINPGQVAIPENNSSGEPFKLHAEKFDWRTMPLANPWKNDKGNPTGFAAPVAGNSKAFTPEQIGNMSREEFDKNEHSIMSQMKNGLIQTQTPVANFSGFTNPVNGSKQIFSREDIGSMSTDEFSANEKAINAQLKA